MTKYSSDRRALRLTAGCRTREEMKSSERAVLAPFAQKSADSRGQECSELNHDYGATILVEAAAMDEERLSALLSFRLPSSERMERKGARQIRKPYGG